MAKEPIIPPDSSQPPQPEGQERLPDNIPLNQETDPEIAAEAQGLTRRFMNKALAAIGVGYVADAASGGAISGAVGTGLGKFFERRERGQKLAETESALGKLDKEAHRLGAQIKAENPEISALEATRKVVDYLGSGLFVAGVLQLIFKKENNHINAFQYAALAALTAIKYELSTPEEQEHLVSETKAAARTLLFIGGAMTIGEGVSADIAGLYEKSEGSRPAQRDLIATMAVLSTGISSTATTLVNSTVVRSTANELATTYDEAGNKAMDADVMAICTSLNTNLSGIALFGNPPFMAICEKYGFSEGITWKIKTMLPLMIYALFSSVYKLNLLMAARSGLSGGAAHKMALGDTVAGLTRPTNIKFLAKTVVSSLNNALRYFTGGKQLDGGIEVKIGEVITEKLSSLAKMPFAKDSKDPHAEDPDLLKGNETAEDGANQLVQAIIEATSKTEGSRDPQESVDDPAFANRINQAIQEHDYDELIKIGQSQNIPQIEIIVRTLKDLHEKHQRTAFSKKDSEKNVPENIVQKLNPLKVLDRATDIDRIKAAAGHNVGDVLNVFPFQAACIPFLVPVFKDIIGGLEKLGLTGMMKDTVIFFMLQVFSMFADNYVACKIGLELLPDKPQVALVGSELGGPFTPIANMSNLGQFSLGDFPMGTALKKSYWHLDTTAVALAWTHAITLLGKIGIFVPPAVLDKTKEHAMAKLGILKSLGV